MEARVLLRHLYPITIQHILDSKSKQIQLETTTNGMNEFIFLVLVFLKKA